MTVYYNDRPLSFVALPDSLQVLEEEMRGAAEDRDYARLNNIYVTLCKEGRTTDLIQILEQNFSAKEIATGVENIVAKVKEMEKDPDYD